MSYKLLGSLDFFFLQKLLLSCLTTTKRSVKYTEQVNRFCKKKKKVPAFVGMSVGNTSLEQKSIIYHFFGNNCFCLGLNKLQLVLSTSEIKAYRHTDQSYLFNIILFLIMQQPMHINFYSVVAIKLQNYIVEKF